MRFDWLPLNSDKSWSKHFAVSIRREDVAEWANQESQVSSVLHAPVASSSWTHTYIIYLKMFYDIRAKWEDASDPEKLQQLYGQMSKLVVTNAP